MPGSKAVKERIEELIALVIGLTKELIGAHLG